MGTQDWIKSRLWEMQHPKLQLSQKRQRNLLQKRRHLKSQQRRTSRHRWKMWRRRGHLGRGHRRKAVHRGKDGQNEPEFEIFSKLICVTCTLQEHLNTVLYKCQE